jgi:hypothetical protein
VAAGRGFDPGGEVLDRASAGLRFLLRRRRRSPGGLVELCHPWESGCDDSPRWDGGLDEPWTAAGWRAHKGRLLASIVRTVTGAPLANPAFPVGSVAFSALVAFNAIELASVTGDAELVAAGRELTEAIDARWDADLRTWVDDGPTASGSGRVRTAEALLPLLLLDRPEARRQLVDPEALGAPFGPCGVHRAEPAFAPTTYWRGPAWPQLTYLFWLASTSAGDSDAASSLASSLAAGASGSGFAEYWEPDSGSGLGATPQSWSTLAIVPAMGA